MVFTLSFEDKVQALALFRAIGFKKTVNFLSRAKKVPPVIMRELCDNIEGRNYLVETGVVELTDAGVLQYTDLNCPQQPKVLTKSLFESMKEDIQEDMQAAFALLKCNHMLKDFKPYPVTRKEPVYGKKITPR